MSRVVFGLLLLTLFAITPSAIPFAQADVEIERADFLTLLNGYWCDIRLGGDITEADAAALDAAECVRVAMFIHDSLGGDVNAAIHIGRWARERDATIAVITDAVCYSSCALVYIGGVRRSNFGEVGIHRPYLAGSPLSNAEIEALIPRMLDEVRDYIDEAGVSPEFASLMINTPPAAMRRYRTDEIYDLVAETDPMHDELHVAGQARNYGTTTDEYRRRLAEAEKACVASQLGFSRYTDADSPELSAYTSARHECQQSIYWDLSRSDYRSRYKRAVELCNAGDPTPDEMRECGIQVMRGLVD